MYKLRQILLTAVAGFYRWRRQPKVWLAFGIGFVICFLLSDKVIQFAETHSTILQVMEPFIWTFGDANSILVISLCLLLLFSDMPSLTNDVPLFLVRTSRRLWLMGQITYVIFATFLYVLFILLSTMMLAGNTAYPANMWSNTAAILSYSEIGNKIAVPAFVKVLEMSFPYNVTIHVFLLVLGYSLVLSSLMLVLNLFKENLGMIGGVVFSAFGVVMNPEALLKLLHLSATKRNIANIIFGWISPLNHATYYMHSFGYDCLPKLWMSYVFFSIVTILLYIVAMQKIKRYAFNFTGTSE